MRALCLAGSPETAKLGEVLITDLPRCQRFREAMLIELRVGAQSRDGSHVDNEIDSGLLQQIGKFDDRPGRMAYGEKGVRRGSNGQAHDNRGRIAPTGSG